MEFTFLSLILVIANLALVGNKMFNYLRICLFSFKLQGPQTVPIFGNALSILKVRKKNKDFLGAFTRVISPYASPVRIWMGPFRLFLFVKDASQVQTILQSPKLTNKSFIYRFTEHFLGKGLFTSTGEMHKKHRKLLQPLFASRVIEGYSHIFQKHALDLVESLKVNIDGADFNVISFIHNTGFKATMNIIFDDKDNHSAKYIKEAPHFLRRSYHLFFKRVSTFWMHSDLLYRCTKEFKEQDYMKTKVDGMIDEMIQLKVPEVAKHMKSPDLNSNRISSMLEVMLEMLEENPNVLSVQECVDHMVTFVATAQDTQSTVVAFTLLMMGLYPDIQDKIVNELREVLDSKSTKTLDLVDTQKLKYMDMCLKESMRLYPVAPLIVRETTEDFTMTFNTSKDDNNNKNGLTKTVTIPKNVNIMIGIYNFHRDARYWEKPLEYYPEHFLPENVEKRHPFAYVPFSSGPRKCIAQQYSYTNMKIVLGSILQNFIVENSDRYQKLDDIKITCDMSVRPVDGYLIKIKNRPSNL